MVITDWPALTQTVTADVQRDDQESCGLQAKSQWLCGWSVARIRGRTINDDWVMQEDGYLNHTASANVISSGVIYRILTWRRKKRTQKLMRTDWKQRVPSWSDRCFAAANQSSLSMDDRARSGVHVKRKHFLGKKKKKKITGGSVSLCLIVSDSFVNVSLSMADVSQIFSHHR